MTYRTITYDVEHRVATVTFDRPERLNAISVELAGEVRAALDEASADPEVGAVVLTGRGRAFSAGADLAEIPASAADIERSMLEVFNPMVRALASARKPVVAMVGGLAVGAGASLALACDLRVCSTAAEFRFAFVKVGLIPDCGATYYLPRLIGYGRAMELCLLGEPVDAATALGLGLVNRVVPPADLAAETGRLARALAGGPTEAYLRTRETLAAGMESDLEATLRREVAMQLDLATAQHFQDASSRFRDRRPPAAG